MRETRRGHASAAPQSGREPVVDIPDIADDDFYPVNEPINLQAP
jgi:hypothetical protein